jgi:presenilin-like A22 family membrane protease
MKHIPKITALILVMFLLTQLIGLLVINIYSPTITQETDSNGNIINVTSYNLPYGVEPPSDINPKSSLFSIIIAIAFAVVLILILMKLRSEIFLRLWFFIVVILALSISLNAFLLKIPNASIIALIIAIPLAIIKVFKRNVIVHNLTELLIYPGIAAIFVPLLSIWTTVLLLILLSIYDMYAVWHAGFMQKMAKYQMEQVKVFPGFFLPYLDKKAKGKLKILNKSNKKGKNEKQIKVPVAILGGGDLVFPLILAGVVFNSLGIIPALLVILGSTIALGLLLFNSERKKAYPAMPFISLGALIALGISYLI